MDKNYFKSKQYSVAEDILSLSITIALTLYLGLGFFVHIWHPTWIVFVGAIIVSVLAYCIGYIHFKKIVLVEGKEILPFNKQFETTFAYAKSVKVAGFLFILTIAVYVIICSFIGMWHPLWLIFFVMATIEQTIALVFKCCYKDYKILNESAAENKEENNKK